MNGPQAVDALYKGVVLAWIGSKNNDYSIIYVDKNKVLHSINPKNSVNTTICNCTIMEMQKLDNCYEWQDIRDYIKETL